MRDLSDDERASAFRFAHVPLHDDAIEAEPWGLHAGDEWRRHFLTREWEVAGLWISVAGEQTHDGGIRRWLHVGGEDQCTTSDLSQLIAALTEAGQLLDTLTNDDGQRVAVRAPARRALDPAARRDAG